MSTTLDYSYRYPVDRGMRFPVLPNAQIKQAHASNVTALSGQTIPHTLDIHSYPGSVGGDQHLLETCKLIQRIPLERDLHKLHPGARSNFSHIPSDADTIDQLSLSAFHRYRRQKDYDPQRVPRVLDITAYQYCPTCCAMHLGQSIGCRRDLRYFTHHTSSRIPFDHLRPGMPFGRSYYNYLHEKLDQHSTGQFWKSRYH
ncbi:uncharacterized protein DEA37_0003073 [Paragonimus westermani]|uniref:Uncharacterized protein n=1 Tax=Paragonimus westermani TaxID=34504 RepID=A0A5J4N4M6_9TREM|nr:uncharacterized protein DEA37_0003073 [Paragonimus westermani]